MARFLSFGVGLHLAVELCHRETQYSRLRHLGTKALMKEAATSVFQNRGNQGLIALGDTWMYGRMMGKTGNHYIQWQET